MTMSSSSGGGGAAAATQDVQIQAQGRVVTVTNRRKPQEVVVITFSNAEAPKIEVRGA